MKTEARLYEFIKEYGEQNFIKVLKIIGFELVRPHQFWAKSENKKKRGGEINFNLILKKASQQISDVRSGKSKIVPIIKKENGHTTIKFGTE